ncbi:MAG: TetR/AcrR family transcriptional regulator [Chloroflexota bacterium]
MVMAAQGARESTADRLLATAAALFRTKGYAASTTRELAALLGIQNASLYHHIGKKEDLLSDICVDSLRRIDQQVREAIAREDSPVGRLRALAVTHVNTALADRDQHATMLADLRALSPDRRSEVVKLRDAYEKLVRETIADGQAVGAARSDVPAKYLALGLLNLLNWSIFWFNPEGELSAQELGAILTTIFLDGVLAPPRSAAPGAG